MADVQIGLSHVIVGTESVVVKYLQLDGRRHVVDQHLEFFFPDRIQTFEDSVALVNESLLVVELDVRVGTAYKNNNLVELNCF